MRRSEMTLKDPDRAEAAFLGRQGASLHAVGASDGRHLAEYDLKACPVFDGMIAAWGCIFISLKDGTIVCFEGDT